MYCRKLLVASVLLLGWACSYSDLQAASPVTLAVDAVDWAVHEKTGRVFATLKDQNKVFEYSPQAEQVREFPVGTNPTELIIKRNLLVVGCTKSPSLHLIDLDTNKTLGSVALQGNGPYALFCSQNDNSYVYAICNTGSAWWDGEVFQIDTQSLQIRNRVKVQRWGQSHPTHVAMSPDGHWIVPDARGKSSPSGADLMKVDEEKCTFTQVRDYHKSYGQVTAGPLNRYWTLGNLLYTLDLTKQVRSFRGSPAKIHPSFDLVASFKSDHLYLDRFSDASPIASIALDKSQQSKGTSLTIGFDLKNDLVFLGTSESANWIDLGDHSDVLQPLRMLRLPSSVTCLVDQPMQVDVTLSNSKSDSATNINIADGPETARFETGTIRWTPTADDVGVKSIRVEAKQADGKLIDAASIEVRVTLPTLELGCTAKSMELSPDGKHLIVWGPTAGQPNRHPLQPGPDELTVIDVENLVTVVNKTLPQGIRCATIDDQWVYLSPNSGNLFYRLSHELKASKRQFLKSTPKQLTKIAPERIAVIGEQLEVFQTDPLQLVKWPSPPGPFQRLQPPIALTSADTIQVGDRVIDFESGTLVRCLGSSLPSIAANSNQSFRLMQARNQGIKRWGRMIQGNALVNNAGSRISQWQTQRYTTLSEQLPAVVSIRAEQNKVDRTIETWLELSSLIDGTVVHSAMISAKPVQSGNPNFYGQQNRLIVQPDRIFILLDNELIVAKLAKSTTEKLIAPIHFSERQPTEISVGGNRKVQLGVGNPGNEGTFSLITEFEGIDIDPKNGELSIQTTTIWDNLVAKLATAPVRPTGPNNNDPLDASVNAAEYKRLTGKSLPAGQLAAQLPISAVVRDSEGQEDATQFSLIVLGPRKPLDDQRQQLVAQAAARKEEAQRQQALRMAEAQMAQAQSRAAKTETKPTDERLDQLETRLRRIEAALDSILKRLDKED
ncbi:hypothetical protein LOC67_12000 [Stieleria sp. JC731]|uniref:cell envelope integrity protein TolA n=1 Tax=Pirellulaceae TaxID=2691357 RepID=UPI001E5227FA|nr:cell envelope integrity protein TolA [Stieleria sp. JC731]MCC9601271.1 hypothetical protein [Stieleria sp. JC731]